MSRLRWAVNPESGTVAYLYNDDGSVASRIDERGVAAAYTYDALGRLRTKGYSDATPAATYNYHQAWAPNVGRLQSVTSASAVAFHLYDALGRVTAQSQTVAGNPNIYMMEYTHWLNDQPKTVRLPSGRVLSYDVDDAGRLTEVTGPDGTYADLTAAAEPYTADGRIAQLRLGNELWETRDYRTPGTPTLLKLGTTAGASDRIELEYNYAGAANNGNLMSHVIRQPGLTRAQSYTYDGVNRLATASESGGFSRTYGYDRYGNRWIQSSSGLTYANAHEATSVNHFNAATNRITVAGATFDAVGNQTYYAPYTLAYDAESRLVSSTSASNGNTSYLYDGDGRRVKKVWPPHGGSPVTTYYIYDAAGQLAAEYQDPAPTQTGTAYVFTDILGSVRAVSGEKPPSGTAALTECHDYLPFGRPLSQSDNRSGMTCYPANPELQLTSSLPQKFTGQERDEFGLDFFQARYLSPGQGRFASVDPVSGFPADPQSWNGYAYVGNNPLIYSDPSGMIRVREEGGGWQDYVITDPFLIERLFLTPAPVIEAAAETLSTVMDTMMRWGRAPRDPGCMALAGGIGMTGGTYVGAGIGGGGGIVVGGGVASVATGSAGVAAGGLAGASIGGTVGAGAGWLLCAQMAGSGGGGGSAGEGGGRTWKFGHHKSGITWKGQLYRRGWTESQIEEAIRHGQRFPAPNNIRPSHAATRYVHPNTGRSVIVDDVTQEILHVGGNGFRY